MRTKSIKNSGITEKATAPIRDRSFSLNPYRLGMISKEEKFQLEIEKWLKDGIGPLPLLFL